MKEKNHLAGGNHARSASSRRRYYAVRIVRRWRRSPWALDRVNLCWVLGQVSNRTRASSEAQNTPTVLPTVPYRRRAVDCRYGMCHVGARACFRPGCGRLKIVFEEQERGQKRRASAGHHHRGPTCMWYRDSLPGHDPGGILAIDLKDIDDFSCSSDKIIVSAVIDHACLSTLVCVIVAKLAKLSVQADTCINKGCQLCLNEWLSSWQLRQSPWFSWRASARGERRPLQRGGSFVLYEAITAKPSA